MSGTTTFTLWGYKASYGLTEPIRLSGGALRECRADQRMRESEGGWLLGIYRQGDAPEGLRAQVANLRAQATA